MSDPRQIVDFDPATKVRRILSADDAGLLHASNTQDVEDRINLNKALQNEPRGRWGEGSRVASLPLVVYEGLIQKGIINRQGAVVDQRAFRRWLNDPDNRAFRTRLGKV